MCCHNIHYYICPVNCTLRGMTILDGRPKNRLAFSSSWAGASADTHQALRSNGKIISSLTRCSLSLGSVGTVLTKSLRNAFLFGLSGCYSGKAAILRWVTGYPGLWWLLDMEYHHLLPDSVSGCSLPRSRLSGSYYNRCSLNRVLK
jgi:hypothetical protein